MKASDTHKVRPKFWRPSLALGLLLLAELIIPTIALSYWAYLKIVVNNGSIIPSRLAIPLGVWMATLGWTTTALLTVRNSVKQHTINTLLQSRLSATYMASANVVSDHLVKYDERRLAGESLPDDPLEGIDQAALRYVLNYMEFVAVGILHGDLHEGVMKSSMRGMIVGMHSHAKVFIDKSVLAQPRAFCNLLWLADRWKYPAPTPVLPSNES